jgi:hypothetical protein
MADINRPMPVTVLSWKAYRRNTLAGFCDVQVGALRIKDVSVHDKAGARWAGMPGKPIIQNGEIQTDDNGKLRYAAMVEWSNKDAADRFSASVVDALLVKHPDAFDGS